MTDFMEDLQRTRERFRTEVIGGKEYTIQCTDPYGLWHVCGTKVEALSGSYTGPETAFNAIRAYEDKKALEEAKPKINDYIQTTDGKGGKKRMLKKDLKKLLDEEDSLLPKEDAA